MPHSWPNSASPAVVAAALVLVVFAAPAMAQQRAAGGSNAAPVTVAPRAVTQAGVRTGDISIDGRIDEAAWNAATVLKNWIQSEPQDGGPGSRDTEARVLFDDDAMYVAARMWDSPDSITYLMLRRDEHTAAMDWVGFGVDPERDGRTSYFFKIAATGVQQDAYISDDTQEDYAWNAVWESKVTTDSLGWMMEARIPLSQIRYESTGGPQTWGFNMHRRRAVLVEQTHFSTESRRINGTVSQYGLLENVRVGEPGRRIEARPYVLSSLHRGPAAAGDPFFDGTERGERVGSDFRVGLGSSFTLDATVNPDFGQVDADPAVINLGAFETRFDERRPFFVEDAQVFDFNLSGGSNQLFYSRRIGRPPHGGSPSGADFSDIPDAATIAGATKLTGRTSSGMSLGFLGALTQSEHGQAFWRTGNRTDEFRVEPRTEYAVASAKQDLRGGLSQLGVTASALHRDLPADGAFENLPDQAYNAGVRLDHQWSARRWRLNGFLAGSLVRGAPAALIAIQRSSVHYFQRPDATQARMDSAATSMAGAEWRLQLDRQNGLHWTAGIWHAGVTKGFEVNDLGFSTNRERLDGGARVTYREIRPGKVFRNYGLGLNTFYNFSWEAFDHIGDWSSWRHAYTNGTFSFSANGTFLSNRSASFNLSLNPDLWSRTATRGGPLMVQPGGVSVRVGFGTDQRRSVSMNTNFSFTNAKRDAGDDWSVSTNISLRPSPAVQISLNPEFSVSRDAGQYVTSTGTLAYAPTFGPRYLFGSLEQKSFSFEVRTNYTVSPTLSFQLYAQPLLSSGDYASYRQLATPGTYDLTTFTEGTAVSGVSGWSCVGGTVCRDASGNEHIDFDANGVADYQFADKDFNVRSLIGNAVLRWEYRPGSAIFFVWQRQQEDDARLGTFDFSRDLGAMLDSPATNRFIVKVNYWLGL